MAVIETWLKTDLKSIVKVTPLHGILFSQDNMANLIGVELLDGGEPATVSGSVSANVLRANGTTVAVAGTLSGNRASVTLPQAAYAYPGMVAIVIKLTSDSVVTTIGAIQAVVYRSSTDTIVDPGTVIPSISSLIAAIDAAVASIPPDYSELTGEVSDLKNAIDYTNNILVSGYKKIPGYYIGSNGVISAGNNYDLHCFQVSPGATINSITDSGAIVYAFYTDAPQIGSTSYNGSRIVRTANTEENVSVPSTANWIAIRSPASGTVTITPTSKTINDIANTITANANAQSAINAATAQKIDDLDCDYIHRFEFSMYGWTANAGGLPTANTSVSRFRTSTFYHFRKGETISVKWTGMQIFPIYCDANGICLNIVGSWFDSITFDQDRYAYFNFKSDDISSFNSIYQEYGYMVHMVNTSKSAWNGKTWYCFGSSMSDINPDGTTGNNGTMGKYPLVIDELSGMTRTNKAIGSGGICPGASHGGNVKENIMECPYDVDLVTLECGLNDWGSVTLGTIGDKSNDTFIGNFTQCIEYLTYHTRAKVVLITMVGTTYTDSTQTTRRSPFFKNSFGYYYRDYIDAMIKVCEMYGVEVIDGEANAMSNGRLNKQTVRDSIHLTYLGGQIFGRYVWSKLKDILEMPNILETMA